MRSPHYHVIYHCCTGSSLLAHINGLLGGGGGAFGQLMEKGEAQVWFTNQSFLHVAQDKNDPLLFYHLGSGE